MRVNPKGWGASSEIWIDSMPKKKVKRTATARQSRDYNRKCHENISEPSSWGIFKNSYQHVSPVNRCGELAGKYLVERLN
jgi:hypothetical protein